MCNYKFKYIIDPIYLYKNINIHRKYYFHLVKTLNWIVLFFVHFAFIHIAIAITSITILRSLPSLFECGVHGVPTSNPAKYIFFSLSQQKCCTQTRVPAIDEIKSRTGVTTHFSSSKMRVRNMKPNVNDPAKL